MGKIKGYLWLFLTMLKIGLFTFGGGYAMIALLENEFVEKKKWLEACKEDSKQWIEVCDYKGWSNQVVKQNNIHKLPANILIDRNRKVLGKDLTEKDLYTTVEQLIKKEEKK